MSGCGLGADQVYGRPAGQEEGCHDDEVHRGSAEEWLGFAAASEEEQGEEGDRGRGDGEGPPPGVLAEEANPGGHEAGDDGEPEEAADEAGGAVAQCFRQQLRPGRLSPLG